MKTKSYILCAFLFISRMSVLAQPPPHDPLGEFLFPPELLMQHQQAIGLNEDQKNFVKGEIRKAQSHFTDLQWQLQDEMEKMASLLKPERVDEQQVLTQLDKVLNLEREIKRSQIGLIVRLKNKLTPEQQAQLREIKNKMREVREK